MKKITLLLTAIALLIALCGCSAVREYDGTPIDRIVYETIDYMGGERTVYTIDFVNNSVQKCVIPPEMYGEEVVSEIAKFTDDEERIFINKIYTYGLLDIDSHYEPAYEVCDGGGWSLAVEYSDGSERSSSGENAYPEKVFDKCAIPFYDLCGEQVLGYLPGEYYTPPALSYSFRCEYNGYSINDDSYALLLLTDYKWGPNEVSDSDIYAMNLAHESAFLQNNEYELVLYTANWGDYERFFRCEMKCYDLNAEMTGERTVFSKFWFKQVEIPLELDKIYVLELTFTDGDFARYTFSTKTADAAILYGEYDYGVYNVGKSRLRINEDDSFTLYPFDYLDDSAGDATVPELCGTVTVESKDGKTFANLNSEDGVIVFELGANSLFLNTEKTTVDVEKYNLIGDVVYHYFN